MLEQIPGWQINFGEAAAEAAATAISSRNISQGFVTEMEEAEVARIVGSMHSIATSSGSTALTLALIAGGAKPGDTVVRPADTWVATAHAAHFLGWSLELADIEPHRPVIDVERISTNTKERAFALQVDMNGHSSDSAGLVSKGYTVIEDAVKHWARFGLINILGLSARRVASRSQCPKLSTQGRAG